MELRPISDHIRPGLTILFVGFNPSIRSSLTGTHYANPSNRFWKILRDSSLTPRLFAPHETEELLRIGYGFTNIVARPTKTAAEITKGEYAEGRKILLRKAERYRPKAMCFVGKGVYEAYRGETGASWGFQPDETVAGVREFVGPSSSGLVRMKLQDVVAIYRELREWKEHQHEHRSDGDSDLGK